MCYYQLRKHTIARIVLKISITTSLLIEDKILDVLSPQVHTHLKQQQATADGRSNGLLSLVITNIKQLSSDVDFYVSNQCEVASLITRLINEHS